MAKRSKLSRLYDVALSFKNGDFPLVQFGGLVKEVSLGVVGVEGLSDKVSIGNHLLIYGDYGEILGEVVEVKPEIVWVKPFDDTKYPKLGDLVFSTGSLVLRPTEKWCGRVINAFAQPLDGLGVLPVGDKICQIESYASPALSRGRVGVPLKTGVKVVDIFTPLCFGQRIGIFAGSGVGKSTLLAMLTQTDDFDIVVLSLTGERGREVRDMLEDTLRGRTKKVITVVSTGDESSMMRRLCPLTATAIAEYFSNEGKRVLLVIDSLTRFALAAREVAIAAHEPPVARGYPPTVFSQLSRLLERAGPGDNGGSITGIYSVLVEGDDHNDPIADSARGVLDGHIVLDRSIASQGRFPAVDVPASISRLANHCWTPEQRKLVNLLKAMMVRYEETRDLRAMGAYKAGGDDFLDKAVNTIPLIYQALEQNLDDVKVDDPYQLLVEKLKNGK